MLRSIHRLATTIITHSSLASRLTQSTWLLRHQFPFTTTSSTPQPNTTTHQDPNLILQTLKDHGFTDTQIANLVLKVPWVSSIRSREAVSSILSYLRKDLGLDPPDLVKVITKDPLILHSSLSNSIIPSITCLETTLGSRPDAVLAVLCNPIIIRGAHGRVPSNVEVLKGLGVPILNIRKLLMKRGRTMVRSPDRFRAIVNDVISAGLDPSKTMFVHAINVKSSVSTMTWVKKVEAFTSFGLSVEEAQLIFRMCPLVYSYSEEKIKKGLDFFLNGLKVGAWNFMGYGNLLGFSLEKTLIPRCCVLNVLMGKGLVEKDIKVLSALRLNAGAFEMRYVDKYHVDAPQVLEAYQGKMKFEGFDHQR